MTLEIVPTPLQQTRLALALCLRAMADQAWDSVSAEGWTEDGWDALERAAPILGIELVERPGQPGGYCEGYVVPEPSFEEVVDRERGLANWRRDPELDEGPHPLWKDERLRRGLIEERARRLFAEGGQIGIGRLRLDFPRWANLSEGRRGDWRDIARSELAREGLL